MIEIIFDCLTLLLLLRKKYLMVFRAGGGGSANFIKDVAKGRNFRKSLKKKREKQRGVKLFNNVKTQMGGQIWKRKSVIKDSDHSRSKIRGASKEAKDIKGVPAFQVRQPQPMQVYRAIFSHN